MKKLLCKENVAFAALHWLYCSAHCMIYSFIVVYLTQHGYSDFQVGLLNALIAGVSMISQPLYGYLNDTFISCRSLMIVIAAVAIPVTLCIPLTVSIVPLCFVAILSLGFLTYTYNCIPEAWQIRVNKKKPYVNYPVTRVMGAVGYSLTGLVAGKLIDLWGFDVIFWGSAAHLVLLIACCLCIEKIEPENKGIKRGAQIEERIGFGGALRILLKNRPYMVFIISTTLYQAAYRSMLAFMPVIVQDAGGTNTHVGMLVFAGAAVEAPMMFIFSRLQDKAKLKHLYTFTAIVLAVRTLALLVVHSVTGLILLKSFEAISWGMYIPLFVVYISRIVPSKIYATSLTIGYSLTVGVGSICGNFFSGLIMENLGTMAFSAIMSAVAIAGVVVFVVGMAGKNGGTPAAEKEATAVKIS
ncbi:MFS transporter [Zongyangia hominis]|uniref:MFS transporter n=1 Tax=Zongyangia hominis TaxID=2763677 RepID=A0A926EDX2_9FIRM|nr:MFS transporter [Zongyangia hominis]MBC8571315.1 MFS transporter [Zongyangia hominis]